MQIKHISLYSLLAWAGATAAAVVGPTAGTLVDGAIAATVLEVNPSGIGHINLVPYFTVRSGFDTYLNVVNTDTRNGKAVKVRFRSVFDGADIRNFTVLLGPGDKWATALTLDSVAGYPRVVHNDLSCTLPANVRVTLGPTYNALPNGDRVENPVIAHVGSLEIITLADIPRLTSTGQLSPLYVAVTAGTGASAPACSAAALDPLALDSANYLEARGKGLDVPTTGLMTQWTLINVPRAVSYTGRATAIEARVSAGGSPGYRNLVLFPQTSLLVQDNSKPTHAFTTSPVLAFSSAYVENWFPDLSTPYLPSGLGALAQGVAARVQAYGISKALAVSSIESEFVTEPGILAKTDWVVTMPTRYLEAGILPGNMTSLPSLAWTDLTLNQAGAPVGGAVKNHFAKGINLEAAWGPSLACVTGVDPYNAGIPTTQPQTETGFRTHEGVAFNVQPASGDTSPFSVCGLGALLRFSKPGENPADGALGDALMRRILLTSNTAGWGRIQIPGVAGRGLPIIGFAVSEFYNAAVAPGVAGAFGQTFPLGTTKPAP